MTKKIYPCDGADASIISCSIEFPDGRVATNYQEAIDMMAENFNEYVQDKYYEHYQTEPSTDWDVKHNLEKKPSVFIEDRNGSDIDGDIEHIDDNELIIHFSVPVSGIAYCN